MTPQQQSALEALAGRSLTVPEIAMANSRASDVLLAASLSAGRTRIVSRMVGVDDVLEQLAPAGGDFLESLQQIAASGNTQIKWTVHLIEDGKLDAGRAVTRAQAQALAASVPSLAPAIAKLLALAEAPAPIDTAAVSAILNGG